MASGPSAAVANQLRAMFQGGTVGGLTDGQLLDRFVQRRDEAAFAALVERHGPMVLRVCSNRLGDPHDAEDAFQATFLVLARKARSIRQSEAVAGWLFGVAGRVAARVRAAGLRRVRAEQKAGISRDLGREDRPLETWTELYEELDRLPEKLRLPLILCYLEGLTYEQAAAQLRCPVRTIQSRLVRGRELMKGRLARRGLAPSAAIFAPALSMDGAKSIVPVSLKQATATAALRFIIGEGLAAGEGLAGALAGEVWHAMIFGRTNAVAKCAILLGLIAAGGWLARPGGATLLPPAQTAGARPAPSPRQAPAAVKEEEGPFRMTGTVRVEGTGEPVAGARVQVDLGTKDLRGDFREAVTDAQGRYTIPLPEGNARPLFFYPPPGYWLPDPDKNWKFFAVTPQQPVYRKDYLVRPGTTWTFRLTTGPKKEPVAGGSASSYHLPGDSSISISARTDSKGDATLTLPDEAGKVTISLSAGDRDEGNVLVKLEWSHGIRPPWKGSSLEASPERRIRLIDEAGGTVTITGPVNVTTGDHPTLVTASLPKVDPVSFGRITGTVIDQDGRPIAGANVTLYHQYRQWGSVSGRDEHNVRTDAQGRFVLRSVPMKSHEGDPCKLEVIVYKDGYAGVDTNLFEFKPGVDGSQSVAPIRLQPGLSLTGRVVDPEGRPVVGALIQAAGSWAQAHSTHRSGPDGRFTIPDLDRGVVRAAFTFGNLITAGSYVVDGQARPVEVRLRPAPERPAARPAPPRPLKIGELAPNWAVRGWTDGQQRSLGDLRGRVVYLDFWGIQFGGAVMALPAIDRLREKYEPRGVVFLSIHTPGESIDEIRKLYQLKKVNLVSAIDEGTEDDADQGATARMYGVGGHPTNVVIDRKGKVAFRSNDPANQAAVAAIVRKLGIDRTSQPTEEQRNQLVEAFLGEAIEKALAQP